MVEGTGLEIRGCRGRSTTDCGDSYSLTGISAPGDPTEIVESCSPLSEKRGRKGAGNGVLHLLVWHQFGTQIVTRR